MIASFMRKLPEFKGKHFLSRIFFKKEITDVTDIWVNGKYNCHYLLPNLKEHVAFEIFINGIHEYDTHNFLLSRLPANGVFLDLGANIGAITIPLCKRRPDVKAIGVEAAPWIFNYLKQNIEKNGLDKNVSLYNYALFDEDKKLMPFFSPKEKFGTGSLSAVFTDTPVEVESIRVDTILKKAGINKVDLIKIDIEGYEYYAFKGAEALLTAPDAPDIFFEFIDWTEDLAKGIEKGSAQTILKEWGYHLYKIEDNKTVPLPKIITEGGLMIYATKNKF
jgi:FkbM family methyltransferase